MNPLLNLYMRQRAANGGRIGFRLGGDYAAEREGTGAYGRPNRPGPSSDATAGGMTDSKGKNIRSRIQDKAPQKKTISEKIASKFDDVYTNLGKVGSLSPTLQALSTGFDMVNTNYSQDPTTGKIDTTVVGPNYSNIHGLLNAANVKGIETYTPEQKENLQQAMLNSAVKIDENTKEYTVDFSGLQKAYDKGFYKQGANLQDMAAAANQTGIGNRPGAENLLASQQAAQAAQAALPTADPFLSQISEDQVGMYNQLQAMGYSPEYAQQYVTMLG